MPWRCLARVSLAAASDMLVAAVLVGSHYAGGQDVDDQVGCTEIRRAYIIWTSGAGPWHYAGSRSHVEEVSAHRGLGATRSWP